VTHHRLLALLFAVLLGAPPVAGAQERATPRREVPGLDFRPNGVWRKQARVVRAARTRLLSQGRFSELNAPLAAGAIAPSAAAVSGTLSVPAVLFTYAGTTAPPFVATDYDAVLFGTTPPLGRPYTYHSFYSQMSNGLLDVQGSTRGWVTLSKPEVSYTGDTSSQCRPVNPFGSANCNGVWSNTAFTALQGALREALVHADSQIDFSKFSFDPATGIVSLVLFMHPTVGGECGPQSNPQNHLWAHRAALFPGYMTNDPWPNHPNQFLQVQDYVLQSGLGGATSCDATQIMPIGTVAHETGHGFGLPDLYDTGGSTEGVGRWSLMGAGNFSSPSSPARMDAWSLSQLGWVTFAPLTATGSYSFGAAPTSDTAFVVRPTGSNPRGEYFLLENRQAVDADTALIRNTCQVWYQTATPPPCSGGLLVWHVDSEQIAQHGFTLGNAVNVGPIHGLELMQADARGNLDANPAITTCVPPAQGCADRGDAGDPYPGILGNRAFGLNTTPNSALNSGGCSGFGLDTITQVVPNGALRFFLRIGSDTLTVTTTSPLVAGQWGYSYAATLTAACGAGSYTWAQPDSGALPPGVVLSSSGALSGAPTDTGTYTFRTSVTDGSKTARRTMTLRVAEPTLTLQQALNVGFQGPAPASDDQRRYLDLQGNHNGTFDLGDLLKWLSRTGNLSTAAASTRVPGTGRQP
jgi:M6 family metalloprotease-like protein